MLRLFLIFIIFCAQTILDADEISLEQKIGQMLMVGFRGSEFQENMPIVTQIRKGLIGGVILYDFDSITSTYGRNIISSGQLKTLSESLQRASKFPLLIAVDQEGGVVNPLKEKYGFPSSLSAQHLGDLDDLSLTKQAAQVTAEVLAMHQINLNFAPVVDLNIFQNGLIGRKQRAYGSDPSKVIRHATAVIEAHRDRGVFTAIKHFPGHGSAIGDTHLGFVDVTTSWSEQELLPFAALIENQKVDLVMTAHVFNRNLDPHYPATLSHVVITKLLREKLGFADGVVITDDLQMKAIADRYNLEETVRLAIEAGADMLLFANQQDYDEEIALRVIAIVQNLISEGKISEERIDQSFSRLEDLKAVKPLKKNLYPSHQCY